MTVKPTPPAPDAAPAAAAPGSRPAYRRLQVYRTEAAPVEVNLADNTNLFGSAPSAVAALASLADLAAYPPLTTGDLRQAIAAWHGVSPDQVVCGCGSNDLIDAGMRAFAEPGSRLAYISPTFVMTPHFAATNSLVPVAVPVGPAFEIDAPGLLATGAPLIYVASPNNPSGTLADHAAIELLLERAPGIVVLDEAYAEFAGVSWLGRAAARSNVVVTRTFSKAWGLAGLRLGYAVGDARLVTELEKARGPYKVNALAERAARAAVEHDRDWLAEVVSRVRRSRERFQARLGEIGLATFPSAANFVAVAVPSAAGAARLLESRGIAVRAFTAVPGHGDLLRITIGPEPVMDRVIDSLAALPR
jgi:histidinol-phosphate aminotransferase